MMNRRQMLMRLNSLEEATVTGNPVTFSTTVAKPLVHSLIGMEPVQAGSGDPSPDNVRPITGWQGVNAWRTGKNLANVSQSNETKKNGGALFTLSYGTQSVTMDTNATAALWIIWEVFTITDAMVGQSVTISGTLSTAQNTTFQFAMSGDSWATQTLMSSSTKTYSIQAADVGKKIGYTFVNTSGSSVTLTNPQFEFGSTATPFAPYSGESVEVTFPAVGKNLFKTDATSTSDTIYSYTVNTDGSIGVECISEHSVTARFNIGHVLLPAGSYILSGANGSTVSSDPYYFWIDMKSGSYSGARIVYNVSGDSSFTLSDATDVYLQLTFGGSTLPNVGDSATFYPMIRVSTAAAGYEPYTNTVYGGTVDLATGTLTVERVTHALTGSESLIENGHGDANQRYYRELNKLGWEANAATPAAISSHFVEITGGISSPFGTVYCNTYLIFYDKNHVFEDVEAFEAWLAAQHTNGTPVQVSYKLATPIVYHLTPQQITALIGDNVLWSNTNADCTVTYLKKK